MWLFYAGLRSSSQSVLAMAKAGDLDAGKTPRALKSVDPWGFRHFPSRMDPEKRPSVNISTYYEDLSTITMFTVDGRIVAVLRSGAGERTSWISLDRERFSKYIDEFAQTEPVDLVLP